MSGEDSSTERVLNARLQYWLGVFVVYALLLLPSTWLLIDLLRDTLTWRYERDTPLMVYMAWLMDTYGYLPWRDFFDMNLLGSYLSYLWIGRLFGWDDLGIRTAEIAVLVAIMAITVGILWRLGLRAAWAAALLFVFLHLSYGLVWTLQRELIALIPIGLGIACASGLPRLHPQWRAWLSGLCIGAAATIKPQFAFVLPFICIYLAVELVPGQGRFGEKLRGTVSMAVMAGMGMALPLLGFLGYLLYNGLVEDFLHTAGYLKYYGQITANRSVLPPEMRLTYMINGILGALQYEWTLIGLVGLMAAFANPRFDDAQRRIIMLLAGVIVALAAVPAVSGNFWRYHYLPMEYAMSLAAGLVFAPYTYSTDMVRRLLPALLVLLMCFQQFQPYNHFRPLYKHGKEVPMEGRPDQVAEFLQEHLQPGDLVQPLDWGGGGMVHAMLYAHARIATKYIYYFHFFHAVDTDYIQNLKIDFLQELDASKPRFLLRGMLDVPGFVRGRGTANRFPEAEAYIAANYRAVYRGRRHIIYERLGEATQEPTPAAAWGAALPKSSSAPPNVTVTPEQTDETARPAPKYKRFPFKPLAPADGPSPPRP
ncbi:MAG: hypothetical protein GC168_06355 [Candidatus Hydrogenedens sp.]|nr:hypothetical protein [Candidatus Hydrogenedens sp.]